MMPSQLCRLCQGTQRERGVFKKIKTMMPSQLCRLCRGTQRERGVFKKIKTMMPSQLCRLCQGANREAVVVIFVVVPIQLSRLSWGREGAVFF